MRVHRFCQKYRRGGLLFPELRYAYEHLAEGGFDNQ